MQTTNSASTPKAFLKTIKLIHIAFTSAVFLFSMITLLLVQNYNFKAFDTSDVFYIIIPVFVAGGCFMSNFLFKRQLNIIDSKAILKSQLEHYQSASIIRYALIEGPAMLCVVTFLITENILFLIIALILIIYLFSLSPTKQRIIEDLKLNHEFKNQFNNNSYNG